MTPVTNGALRLSEPISSATFPPWGLVCPLKPYDDFGPCSVTRKVSLETKQEIPHAFDFGLGATNKLRTLPKLQSHLFDIGSFLFNQGAAKDVGSSGGHFGKGFANLQDMLFIRNHPESAFEHLGQ